MVLNALSIDPKRPWKGSWRWFHEELLDCCLPLSKVAQEGVVLTQVRAGRRHVGGRYKGWLWGWGLVVLVGVCGSSIIGPWFVAGE